MDRLEILKYVDHTLLAQDATWEDIGRYWTTLSPTGQPPPASRRPM